MKNNSHFSFINKIYIQNNLKQILARKKNNNNKLGILLDENIFDQKQDYQYFSKKLSKK